MKCPKCGYLGFEHVDRCRNCGYEFSLVDTTESLELPIRSAAPTPDPLADLALVDAAAIPPKTTPARPLASTELPLFGFSAEPDDSQIEPARPRNVVLRRPAIADVPRRRLDAAREQMLDLGLEPPNPRLAIEPDVPFTRPAWASSREVPEQREELERKADIEQREDAADAGLATRLFAVLIDIGVLAAVDAVVVYFTLAICGITLAELSLLPKGPLLAFLFVQNAGYLVAFTAGGQTLGKMLAGIKVVSDGSDEGLDLGRAALRTAVWVLLAVPAGLGFLTALFSNDHRGLHDRFAQTRVVRG
jgi:uncharacterized RDD family membrane protein YckC